MPGTFGWGRKAALNHDKRNQNQYTCEKSTPYAYPDRRACHADGRNSSIHRSHSAPLNQQTELLLPSPRLASGDDLIAEREDTSRSSGQQTYGHSSVPDRSNVSYAAYLASRKCKKHFHSLNNRPHNSVGGFAPNSDLQNSCESRGKEPSFHQIYGPSLRFHTSSPNTSSVDITSPNMGNVDVECASPCDTRNKISKSPHQLPDSTMPDVYNMDGDGVNHNSARPRIYTPRDTNKHVMRQRTHFAEDNDTMPSGESDVADQHAPSSIPKSSKEDTRHCRGNVLRCSQRHVSYNRGQNSPVISQDEGRREYSQRHTQNQNYQTINEFGSEYSEEPRTQQIFTRTKDSIRHSSESSRQRQGKDRSVSRNQTSSGKNYGSSSHPRSAAEPQKVNNVHSTGVFKDRSMKSPTRREHADHSRRSHLEGLREQNEFTTTQTSAKKDSKNIGKDKKADITFDLPVAELTEEWLRFRNAEEAGDWLPTGEEGVNADSPPMKRFLNFLKCQYMPGEGDLVRKSGPRQPANRTKSKSNTDLSTQQHLEGKCRQIRTSKANLPPDHAVVEFQPPSMHSPSLKVPGPKTIHPTIPPMKPDVPRWETLSPALQVEHAAVITNQLCRAMVLQAAQGQGKFTVPARTAEKNESSRDSRGSHSSERPRSVPVFRTKETSEDSDVVAYSLRPKHERYYPRSNSRRADPRVDKFLDEKPGPGYNRTAKVTPLRGGGPSNTCDRPWCPANKSSNDPINPGGPMKGGRREGICREGVPVAVFNFTECAATFQQYMHTGDMGDDIECF